MFFYLTTIRNIFSSVVPRKPFPSVLFPFSPDETLRLLPLATLQGNSLSQEEVFVVRALVVAFHLQALWFFSPSPIPGFFSTDRRRHRIWGYFTSPSSPTLPNVFSPLPRKHLMSFPVGFNYLQPLGVNHACPPNRRDPPIPYGSPPPFPPPFFSAFVLSTASSRNWQLGGPLLAATYFTV